MMTQDTEETPVVFRMMRNKWGGYVIAIFFEEPGTYDPATCSDYVHIGQHGSCDPQLVVSRSRAARPEEYADLKAELEGEPFGYLLKVYRRIPRRAFEVRYRKLTEYNQQATKGSNT